MINGHSQKEPSQAKERWRKRRDFGGAALCPEQSCIPVAFKPRSAPADRYCHAIQHLQQRNASSFISVHEREERLDFCLCIGQGQKRIAGSRTYLDDRARATAKQGILVWINLAGARPNRRFGNFGASLAKRGLCAMGTSEQEAEATATSTRDQGKALPKYADEKRIALFVARTRRASDKSVHRTRGAVCMSVQRIYVACYSPFLCLYTGHLLVLPLLLAIHGAKDADIVRIGISDCVNESTAISEVVV